MSIYNFLQFQRLAIGIYKYTHATPSHLKMTLMAAFSLIPTRDAIHGKAAT
jgi:hypothetical protein